MQLDETSDPRAFIIRDVFIDSYNYMKSGTLIRQVANKINEIDFNNLNDRHLFNDLYEKILKDLQSAGNAGEYYTPRAVTQFMADMLDVKIGESILDPACGTGGFLICAIENLRKEAKGAEDLQIIAKSINGIEKKPMPHLLCTTNMILHDIDEPMITHGNSLSKKALRDYTSADQVDIILTNPPFGGTEEPGIEDNFPKKYRTRETLQKKSGIMNIPTQKDTNPTQKPNPCGLMSLISKKNGGQTEKRVNYPGK
jgi:type I restriction enzyme M protein